MTADGMDTTRDVMVKIDGKTFRCPCGCNVFRWMAKERLCCNSCLAVYVTEARNEVEDKEVRG